MRCGTIDIEKLEADRDQLWAEALQRYKDKSPWWLDTDELNQLASEEQEARYETGVWDETILTWLDDPTQRTEWDYVAERELPITPFNSTRDSVTITDVLVHAVRKKLEACNQGDRKQVARCLTHAGWTKARKRVGGKSLQFYTRTGR